MKGCFHLEYYQSVLIYLYNLVLNYCTEQRKLEKRKEKKEDFLCQKLFGQTFYYSNAKVHRDIVGKLIIFRPIIWLSNLEERKDLLCKKYFDCHFGFAQI